jgi:hypothetical protein
VLFRSPEPARPSFTHPQAVVLQGYAGDAMEPFLTRDGHYLLFNNSNDPSVNTDLHYAERLDELTFQYRGEIEGVNTPALEGVPSLDLSGILYFVSTRSYADTLSTLYSGRFSAGRVSSVGLVAGVSRNESGLLNFDAEIDPDGTLLYFVDGRFAGGAVPETADIVIAQRVGFGFERLANSAALLDKVNTSALEYAPTISADGLELFFTRFDAERSPREPTILRAWRSRPDAPFEVPEREQALEGFVEAPSLSLDGSSLYYHKKENGRFVLYRASR